MERRSPRCCAAAPAPPFFPFFQPLRRSLGQRVGLQRAAVRAQVRDGHRLDHAARALRELPAAFPYEPPALRGDGRVRGALAQGVQRRVRDGPRAPVLRERRAQRVEECGEAAVQHGLAPGLAEIGHPADDLPGVVPAQSAVQDGLVKPDDARDAAAVRQRVRAAVRKLRHPARLVHADLRGAAPRQARAQLPLLQRPPRHAAAQECGTTRQPAALRLRPRERRRRLRRRRRRSQPQPQPERAVARALRRVDALQHGRRE